MGVKTCFGKEIKNAFMGTLLVVVLMVVVVVRHGKKTIFYTSKVSTQTILPEKVRKLRQK